MRRKSQSAVANSIERRNQEILRLKKVNRDLRKKVKALSPACPDEGRVKEKCPVCSGEGMTRKPLAMGSCDRCGGTGLIDGTGTGTEKPEGEVWHPKKLNSENLSESS